MATRIVWTTGVEVSTGLKLATARTFDVTATDHIQGRLPAKAEANPGTLKLDIQPSAKILFLAIVSSHYSADILFTNEGGAKDIPLEEPVFLTGAAAIDKLLTKVPKTFTFTNNGATAADITVFVGREAKV